MPAIAGIIWKGDHPESDALQRMTECMVHEDFYSSGTLSIKEMRVDLAWVCHLRSFGDCMPVWNEAKDICLIFTGEDFCDPQDIQALRIRNHRFDPSNASYLVHLYEEKGPSFVERLNGWFSGVVVDFRSRQVLLFNDRYALSRIYCHETPEAFYFSSEAKSLLRVLPLTRELDLQAFGELLSCGCPLGGRTLFRGVSLLPNASVWAFSGNRGPDKQTYFRPDTWENQPPLDSVAYRESLVDVLSRILPRYFRGSGAVGISLTGGVDSRMIMAYADAAPYTVPSYTFSGPYRESVDLRMARRVAGICKQSHETISVGTGFLQEFSALAEKAVYLSDGTMDVSGSVELYVNRAARSIAGVRLTGNYGGEVLRSLIAFKPTPADQDLLEPQVATATAQAAETYSSEMRGDRLSFIAFKQVPWHHYARLSVEQSQVLIRSPFLDNDLVSLAYRAPKRTGEQMALHVIAARNPALGSMETGRGIGSSLLPISQLRRMWQEFTFKSEYAWDYGMPEWLARLDHGFAPFHAERFFLGRHKFYHFRVWYRDSLAGYVQEILLDNRTLSRPFFNRRRVREIVESHVRGTANHTLAIHRLLTCEFIHRRLLESG